MQIKQNQLFSMRSFESTNISLVALQILRLSLLHLQSLSVCIVPAISQEPFT